MSEHAFDPVPDEQADPVLVSEPNAIVTAKQVAHAVEHGRWQDKDASRALWFNMAFAPKGHDVASLAALLGVHGVMVAA